VVLANILGLQHKGFVIDRTRDLQVWNQPVWSYRSTIDGTQGPSPGAAEGTVKEVIVTSDVSYTVETQPRWDAWGQEAPSQISHYRYRLELDAGGNIIGGEWLTADRPDFMWMQEAPVFADYFAPLKAIYEASIGQR
jgi:hypothetical protein